MRKWILCSLLLLSTFVQANNCDFTEKSFSRWMMEYFRTPEPAKFSCALSFCSNSRLFEEHRDGRMPAAHFFAYALEEDDLIKVYKELAVGSSVNEQMFMLHVLWVKNTQKLRALIEEAPKIWPEEVIGEMVKRMLSEKPGDLLENQPKSPGELDNLWAVFFATGNEHAVEKIASVLPLKNGSGMGTLLGGSASWSLTANSRQYPEVRAVVERLLKNAHGEQKEALKDVLANASKRST